MKELSDPLLLEAYSKAVELNLRKEFIDLLKAEMNRRNLEYHHETLHPHSSNKNTLSNDILDLCDRTLEKVKNLDYEKQSKEFLKTIHHIRKIILMQFEK